MQTHRVTIELKVSEPASLLIASGMVSNTRCLTCTTWQLDMSMST